MPLKSLWVSAISCSPQSDGMRLLLKITERTGVVRGASVDILVTAGSAVHWNLAGTSDSLGNLSVLVPRPLNKGDYHFIVSNISCSGYQWDKGQGVAEVLYHLAESVK